MKLLIQSYLETHTLKELISEHGIYASLSKNKRKVSLNYDMIETKENDVLSWDCRGLILAKADFSEFSVSNSKLDQDVIIGETQIVAFGMRRFFNYGQGAAANVNWSDPNLEILEKLDGTLCIVYYDDFIDEWCVATRSMPEADLPMDNGIFTFRTLFEKALKDTCGLTFEEYTKELNKQFTYCFELTTPYNRIVVNYLDCKITLLTIRDLETGQELSFDQYAYNLEKISYRHGNLIVTKQLFLKDIGHLSGVPLVKSYSYSNIDDLLNWVSSLNPIEHEGVVVRDKNFNRIKIKNASYVALSKVKDRMSSSERNILEIILKEKDDDVKQFLPEEIINNMEKIKSGLINALKYHDMVFQEAISNIDPSSSNQKKDFALFIQKKKNLWTAPLFQMNNNKASNMRDFINKNLENGSWSDSFLNKLLEISKKHII